MTDLRLIARSQAAQLISEVFSAQDLVLAHLEVCEDKAFTQGWLKLAEVTLKPSSEDEEGHKGRDLIAQAVSRGFYELRMLSRETIEAQIVTLPKDNTTLKPPQVKKLVHALTGVTHALQRLGLYLPSFDAAAVSAMPYSKSITIVSDTNGVLQGALSFAARYLCPAARLKVPAIVQMELLTWVDNYLSLRRAPKAHEKPGSLLYDHMRGQGAQRALLRLQLLAQTEMERLRFGTDPLRGVVQPDSDKEHDNLGLQVVQRSFVDRLVFETAIQHLHASSPGHQVALLTSDQGLARMALSEGLQVLFFNAAHFDDVAGTTLSGTAFHPFSRAITAVPLCSLLWELAVTFGSCRLRTDKTIFEIHAMGESLAWTPYHVVEDLLWVRTIPLDLSQDPAHGPPEAEPQPALGDTDAYRPTGVGPEPPKPEQQRPGAQTGSSARRDSSASQAAAYKFSPKTMVNLIQTLAARTTLTVEELMTQYHFTHERKVQEYRGFLAKAGLINFDGKTLTKTGDLDTFWDALRNGNFKLTSAMLLRVPSLSLLYGALAVGQPLPLVNAPIRSAALPNLKCMLELVGLAMNIEGEGLYATPSDPLPTAFAQAAFETYLRLARKEGIYVATGLWLEELTRREGIHPIHARRRLEEARVSGLIERYVEGSTPDTRFAQRTFCATSLRGGELFVEEVSLFEGDFLLPGRSSVSMRLKRPTNES